MMLFISYLIVFLMGVLTGLAWALLIGARLAEKERRGRDA